MDYSHKKNKYERLETVRNVIQTHDIADQTQLMAELKRNGVSVTQPTLSRYLHKLKAVKELSPDGRPRYRLPETSAYKRVAEQRDSTMSLTSGFVSVRYAGNMGVIKTLPGYAASLAYHIDSSNPPFILGTIAGDDTIFIVRDLAATDNDVTAVLKGIIPDMV